MRRIIAFLISALFLGASFFVSVSATEVEGEVCVWVFEDGSYITESFSMNRSRASGTVSGSKTRNFFGSDGDLEWKVVLSGSFTYTGTSATCTSSTCNVTIYDSNWYTVSKFSNKSGNTATASATIGEKLLGVTVRQVPVSLSISCDKDGNLS